MENVDFAIATHIAAVISPTRGIIIQAIHSFIGLLRPGRTKISVKIFDEFSLRIIGLDFEEI